MPARLIANPRRFVASILRVPRPRTLVALLLLILASPAAQGQAAIQELVSGWYVRPPYQMEIRHGDMDVLTGLDIMISGEVLAGTACRPVFEPMSWAESLAGLAAGTVDFVPGGYWLPEREAFAYFSIPYRTEEMVVYHREGLRRLGELETLEALVAHLRARPYRMAYTEGFAYGDARITAFFADPPATLTRVPSSGYTQTLQLVLGGEADFFVANPVVMDRMLLEHDLLDAVRKGRARVSQTQVHFLFSKRTVTPEQVERFNDRIREMRDDGTLERIHIDTILPFYIGITTNQPWFQLVTLLGIVAFSLSGILLARRERYNIFGALVLGTLPAIGGGVLRDILLGTDQIFVLETPLYFLTPIVVVAAALPAFKLLDRLRAHAPERARAFRQRTCGRFGRVFGRLFHFFDAWAVAAFTVIGVSVAIEMRSTPLWLWGPAMGVLTASGGVVLRDMVRSDFNIEMLKKDSYAEISILGGLLYTAILIHFPEQFTAGRNVLITLGVILLLFTLRFLVLWHGWENPFQFGQRGGHAEEALADLRVEESGLWQRLERALQGEAGNGSAAPSVSLEAVQALDQDLPGAVRGLRVRLEGLGGEGLEAGPGQIRRLLAARMGLLAGVHRVLREIARHGPEPLTPEARMRTDTVPGMLRRLVRLAGTPAPGLPPATFAALHALHDELERTWRALYRAEGARRGMPEQASPSLHAAYALECLGFLLREYLREHLEAPDAAVPHPSIDATAGAGLAQDEDHHQALDRSR